MNLVKVARKNSMKLPFDGEGDPVKAPVKTRESLKAVGYTSKMLVQEDCTRNLNIKGFCALFKFKGQHHKIIVDSLP